jgi:hypothetical protein
LTVFAKIQTIGVEVVGGERAMSSERNYAEISQAIRSAISDTPKKSKQVLLKTLLKQYG